MKTVAYLGIPGTYSHLAAQHYFQDNEIEINLIGMKQFRDIFAAIDAEKVPYGLIPVENSLAGSVYDNYDLLSQYPVSVIGEHYLKIDLQLLGTKSKMPRETRIAHISKVVSHYKALEQCEEYLNQHPWMQKEVQGDTAGAAKFVADQKDPFLAALASRETAEIYGLDLIEENVHDNPHNYTRFLVIAKHPEERAMANKCSIIFTLTHAPGSLYTALQVLSTAAVNLVKIESRPIPGRPFEYTFYVDFDWKDQSIDQIRTLLTEFQNNTSEMKILGYYQSGLIPQVTR